jgi:tripartite-type tricarboxylate transporter receptor subunit TctC
LRRCCIDSVSVKLYGTNCANESHEDHVRPVHAIYVLLACWCAVAGATAGIAQEWPTRPIQVVSPFATGTTSDLVASVVLNQVSLQIGQSFNIENRPGGGGTVGVMSVVHANPDGYTLLLSSSAMSTAVILHKSLPYDALRDLEPVAMLGSDPSVLATSPGKGFMTVANLVAAAKAKPGELKFASVGIGSASHIAGERFCQAAGLNVQHVIYPGPVQALDDLMAGRIDFYFIPIAPAVPLYRQGRIVVLAVSAPSLTLPSVPTLAKAGYPIAPSLFWRGLSAPAKTPHDVVDKLNAAIVKVVEMPVIRNKFQGMGVEPMPMSPEQYGTFVADDIAAMTKLGKDAHIEPQD